MEEAPEQPSVPARRKARSGMWIVPTASKDSPRPQRQRRSPQGHEEASAPKGSRGLDVSSCRVACVAAVTALADDNAGGCTMPGDAWDCAIGGAEQAILGTTSPDYY